MKKLCKRAASFLLTAVLLVNLFSVTAFADTQLTAKISEASGVIGDTVDVTLSIEGNPGLSAFKGKISYDETLLTLNSITYNTEFGGQAMQPETLNSPVTLTWLSPLEDVGYNGVFATLNFTLAEIEDDQAVSAITMTYDEDDVYNIEYTNLPLVVSNGSVTVYNGLPGDINKDGKVNLKDATRLFQYLAGWNVEVDQNALDCNGDGKFNLKDATRLFQYVAEWPVEIHYGHAHFLTETEAKAATCKVDGNIAYWYCSGCGKYFSDAEGKTEITLEETVIPHGHTVVIDPAVPATYESKGLTEGSHCSVCHEILVAQEEYGPLTQNTANITYKLAYVETTTANGTKAIVADNYIAQQTIDNTENPNTYTIGTGVNELKELSLDGYDFLGWFESPQVGATRVYNISSSATGDKILYAVWSEKTNKITYKLYQTPLDDTIDSKYCSYTTSKGLADLPNPTINNYVFLGWYTNDGEEVTEIPAGTSGDIVLNAYWTSKRNIAYAKDISSAEPIVLEDTDNGVIYFAYELGTIENIPLSDALWTIQSVSGLAQQKSETYTTSLSQTKADAISSTISNSTINSDTWTLSEGWNNTISGTKEYAETHGTEVDESVEKCKSSSNTLSVTTDNGGCNTTTTTDGTTTLTYDSKNYTHGNSAEFGAKIEASYSNEKSLASKATGTFEISGELSADYEQHQETTEHSGTDTTKVDTTVTSGTSSWNRSGSSSNTEQASEKSTVSQALSDIISETTGYGESYATNGENSSTRGTSSSESNTKNSSSTLTWSSVETKTVTQTYSTDGKSEGCYRLVIAGIAHVFGVVGYDVATHSFFTYTFSVMDDKQYEFLDYSPDLKFNDCEYSVLPFEIPYEVYEYVSDSTFRTEGLSFTTNSAAGTATLNKYEGTSTDVTVPDYITSGDVAYRVTELNASAFAGKDIRSIKLSRYIKELPAKAFKDCTKLEQISGYYNVIGDEAFSGCTSLENYNITVSTKAVGQDAFLGVPSIVVNAISEEYALDASGDRTKEAKTLTQQLIDSAIGAGANRVILNLNDIISGCELTIDVPEIEYFELIGSTNSKNLRTLNNFALDSSAKTTVLKNLKADNSANTPLTVTSDNLTLSAVDITSSGYCLLLPEETEISLIKDNHMVSRNAKAAVCYSPTLVSLEKDSICGYLSAAGNIYVYGSVTGIDNVTIENGSFVMLTLDEFNNYIKGAYSVTFDVNGGNALSEDESEKTVYYGSTYGTLPTPTLTGYTFDGWYTEKDGGTAVTESTVFSDGQDRTLYAHWSPIYVTALQITNAANKIQYYAGDSFSADGLQVKATYNDGSSKSITYKDCTVTTPTMTNAGIETVKVTYGGVSTSYDITIRALTISLSCDTSTANSGYVKFSASAPCGTVSYSSSNTNVVSIDSAGKATFGNTMGSATITATVRNGACSKSATKTLSLSNTGGTKYKETSSASTSNVLYAERPAGYSTDLPVTTGSIPSYTTNSADITGSTSNTSTGKIVTSYAQNGVNGYVYYQFNYNSSTGGDNEDKIINYQEGYRYNLAADTSHNYYYYTSYGRQFYSSNDYPEHESSANWTRYYARWWAYQDKQAGHTWYKASGISGALAASWYRFPVYNYTKTTTTYTYYYYSIA